MNGISKSVFRSIKYLFMAFMALLFFFPIDWLLVSSFSSLSELLTKEFRIFPGKVSLLAYKTLLTRVEFIGDIINSLVVAFATTVITISVCSLGG